MTAEDQRLTCCRTDLDTDVCVGITSVTEEELGLL